ncbi:MULTISPECIES: helix-turn-helix domain-containing protein [Maricaulis]|jgi:MerR family mercuric resistance operon transcriptional regulator|uniref:MerR family transcriptional regulator n=2 Tax=Alphaproteobacteria TaxID=28211 RepID=A0A9W6IPA3_9PROT|nr:helix-turn-helix domain-containing protein [Maricaulis virginensis]GLK53941.1 MerR family transcriptional regulator [Maricaulis virginensis]
MRALLRRGELARQLACNIETIRYYETIGLIGPTERSSGGHRLYSKADRTRLRFVLRLRELGFSLDEVRSLIAMVERGAHTCGQIADMADAHRRNIRRKIEDLQRLERSLSGMLAGCHRGDTPDCAILEALAPE